MADSFVLSGFITANPSVGAPSGFPSVNIPLDERVSLTKKTMLEIVLSADAPVAVPFGSVASACVVHVKTSGGHVKVTATSADGATQAWPVDGVLELISRTVPITALTLTRDPGVDTTVEVFLGDRT